MKMIPISEPLTAAEANSLSMLALAHVGDAVYELLIRSMLAYAGPSAMQELHRKTVSFVRAEAQEEAAQKILPLLDDAEAAVYRRGRNCRVHGVPAHANPAEYHSATGLESLFGWLYLQGLTERIGQLFAEITEERTGDGSEC